MHFTKEELRDLFRLREKTECDTFDLLKRRSEEKVRELS
jgi:DNA-binding GntR family transcriptional regulator